MNTKTNHMGQMETMLAFNLDNMHTCTHTYDTHGTRTHTHTHTHVCFHSLLVLYCLQCSTLYTEFGAVFASFSYLLLLISSIQLVSGACDHVCLE